MSAVGSCGSLAADAERVLTDRVLIRLIAHEHILGPYRPCYPLVRSLLDKLLRRARRQWSFR